MQNGVIVGALQESSHGFNVQHFPTRFFLFVMLKRISVAGYNEVRILISLLGYTK